MKQLLKRIGAALLLCFVAFNVFVAAQLDIFPGSPGSLRYAPNNFYKPFTPRGNNVLDLAPTTGGVTFKSVAVPKGNAVGKLVSLDYNPKRDDGDRLHITIGDTSVNSRLYDWEIVAIARYVNGRTWASLTLFSPPDDPDPDKYDSQNIKEDVKKADKLKIEYWWIKYNPGLANTIVGFNLFLVDAMLVGNNSYPIDPEIMHITDNFPEIPGYTDFSANSSFLATSKRQESIMKISEELRKAGQIHRPWTYIYTDDGVEIKYWLDGDEIKFSGYPSYKFMKPVSITHTLTLKPLNHTNRSSSSLLPVTVDVPVPIEKNETIKRDIDLFPYSNKLKEYIDAGYEIDTQKNKFKMNYGYISDLNSFMRENYEAVKMINPVVYNSAERACHWTAFFLAVKGVGSQSKEWLSFLRAIDARYPCKLEDPDNEENIYPEYSYKTPRLWMPNWWLIQEDFPEFSVRLLPEVPDRPTHKITRQAPDTRNTRMSAYIKQLFEQQSVTEQTQD